MSKKILVVEDNFMNKILVKEMLTMHGYEVIEAGNGLEAVDMATREKPAAILMDIQLPELDGIEATKRIKQSGKCDGIPVVAITASAMAGDEEFILNKGFDGYVPKPIELKKLLAVVAGCVKGGGN